MPKVVFKNKGKSFFNEINGKVEEYFQERKIKKTGNTKLFIKSGIFIAAGLITYYTVLFIPLHPAFAILLCVLLGFIQAGIGFNVMHDANHGSFSDKKWINSALGLTANVMGVNAWID